MDAMTALHVLKMLWPYGRVKSQGGVLAVSRGNQSGLLACAFFIQMSADQHKGLQLHCDSTLR